MKKLLSVLTLVAMLFALCIPFTSCGKGGTDLSFGEKYVYEYGKRKETLVFEKDGTGTHTLYVEHNRSILDATITFKWSISNDGSMYLFTDKVTLGDKSVDTNNIWSLYATTNNPCSFSADVIGYIDSTGTTLRFIREGSDIAPLGSNNREK